MKSTTLFNQYDLYTVLQNQKAKNNDAVLKLTIEEIANEELEVLVNKVAADLQIETIEFLEEEISVDNSETQVDVSQDFSRAVFDRSRPVYINGIQISYFVPFKGDKELFKCRPNQFTYNPPHAVIGNEELIFAYSVVDGEIGRTKVAFDRDFSSVKQWTGWVNDQIRQFNDTLLAEIRPQVAARQQLISQSKKQVDELGFKIREKTEEKGATPISKPSVRKQSSKVKDELIEVAYDVALSFAGENRAYVEKVAELLRDKGISVFYDKFNKADLWGKNLIDHLGKVYAHNSRFIVMFISADYAIKDWPNHERKFAQDRALRMQEDCILPARFDDTEINGMPSSLGYINLRETSPEELVDLIIEKINS